MRVVRLVKFFSRTSKVTKATKTVNLSKISKALRVKSEIPRTGKALAKIPKEEVVKK